jgi:hypothetical protein
LWTRVAIFWSKEFTSFQRPSRKAREFLSFHSPHRAAEVKMLLPHFFIANPESCYIFKATTTKGFSTIWDVFPHLLRYHTVKEKMMHRFNFTAEQAPIIFYVFSFLHIVSSKNFILS